MKGWEQTKLKEVCSKITVGHVGSMADKYRSQGIPFLRSQNIKPYSVSLDNLVYIDEDFNNKLKKSILHPGDLAIVRTGYPGTAAVIPTSLPICNCSDLVIIKPGKKVNAKYLCYIFNSIFGKDLVGGRLVGAAQQHFNITTAKELTLNLPPLPIQRKIAAVLSAYDDLIENNNRRIAILEKMAEELYREWFVRLRFPGHENVKIVKGVPEGWEVKKLGEIIHFEKGKNPPSLYLEKATDNDIYLNVDAIEKKNYQYALKQKSVLCNSDETLMLMDGARSSVVFTGHTGIVSSTFSVVRTERKYRPMIHQFFQANFEALVSNNTGSAIPHANKEFITRMGIYLPKSDDLINDFNTKYVFISSEINTLKRCTEILTNSRDRLLSRLMSGKLDVENLDIEFPPSMKEDLAN